MPKAADPRRWVIGAAVLVLTVVLSALTVSAVAATTMPAKGRLLVATENITDPRFRESVVLIFQHDATGTIGFIINKPLSVSIGHVFPSLPKYLSGEQPLFYGGPVNSDTSWVVFSGEKPLAGAMTILPGLQLGPAPILFSNPDFRPVRTRVRILNGYAGWAPGQLNGELERGDWTVMPANQADVFKADPDSLWKKLHGSQGVLI